MWPKFILKILIILDSILLKLSDHPIQGKWCKLLSLGLSFVFVMRQRFLRSTTSYVYTHNCSVAHQGWCCDLFLTIFLLFQLSLLPRHLLDLVDIKLHVSWRFPQIIVNSMTKAHLTRKQCLPCIQDWGWGMFLPNLASNQCSLQAASSCF